MTIFGVQKTNRFFILCRCLVGFKDGTCAVDKEVGMRRHGIGAFVVVGVCLLIFLELEDSSGHRTLRIVLIVA